MTEFEKKLKNSEYIGIVEDNIDPDKKQKIKVRIPFLFGEKKDIPTEHLPQCHANNDNNGLSFQIPDKNKLVIVTFPTGDLYYPEYKNALHLNINLQKKIEELSDEEYVKFISLCYNHNAQLFIHPDEGINFIFKFNKILIGEKNIDLDLSDNSSTLNLGDSDASQEAVLGTRFFNQFDKLMQTLVKQAFIGNLGAPCVADPELIKVFAEYNALKMQFLSQHVYIVDNYQVQNNNFKVESQIGDNIDVSDKLKKIEIEYEPIKHSVENRQIQEEHTNTVQKNNDEVVEEKLDVDSNDSNVQDNTELIGDDIVPLDLFKKLCYKGCSDDNAKKLHKGLNYALTKFNVRTPVEISLFLGQCMEETGRFKAFKELGNAAYFAKYKNNNIIFINNAKKQNPKFYKNLEYIEGDELKYIGRGAIQLTFKLAYFDFTKYCQDNLNINVDFVNDPGLVATADYTFLSGLQYQKVNSFSKKQIKNSVAKDDILTISRIVNGTGMYHMDKRINETNFVRKTLYPKLNTFNTDKLLASIDNTPNKIRKNPNNISKLHDTLVINKELYT